MAGYGGKPGRTIVSPPSLRSHFGFNLMVRGDPRHDLGSPVVLSRSGLVSLLRPIPLDF